VGVNGRWESVRGVRAVIFDLGGTVISIDHPRVARYLAEAGCPPGPGWVGRAERAGRLEVDRLVRAGTPPPDPWRAFWEEFLLAAGATPEALDPLFHKLVDSHRRQHLWNRPEPGMVEALGALARLGYRVAAVSNSDGRAEQLLASLGIARDFEFVVDSTEVGIEKPDPRIFHLACARLGLAPGQCAYVGDLVSVDVEGAAAAGLRPVLMDLYGSYRMEEVPDGVPRAVEASELVAGLHGGPAEPGEGSR
jgi:HAD superfamily hydrolase (TIGR01549 family)